MPGHFSTRLAGAVTIAALAIASGSPARADSSAISTLAGSWSGNGRITYTDGSSEGIHCSAFYTGGGSDLNMSIQCKSDRNPIHIRSKLRFSGSRISGNWEERTFNASGSATGTSSGSSLNLKVSGGGFSGTMAVSFSRSSHTVTITTEGISMRRATMNLRKN